MASLPEVELDVERRRQKRRRAAVLVLGSVFAAVVLFVSEVHPLRWWHEHERVVAERIANGPKPAPMAPLSVVQPTPRGNDSSISPTPQRLRLAAVRLGRNANEGYAEIGVDPHSPQTYKAGSVLVNGARLQEIYRDRVVLARNGKRAWLYLEGAPEAHAAVADTVLDTQILLAGGSTTQPLARPNVIDPLGQVLRASAVYGGDAFEGVQLYASTDVRRFEQLGLKDGDVITSLNGQPPGSPADAIEQLQTLAKGKAIAVTIKRGASLVPLMLDGRVLK